MNITPPPPANSPQDTKSLTVKLNEVINALDASQRRLDALEAKDAAGN
jgi:hypothetical protein